MADLLVVDHVHKSYRKRRGDDAVKAVDDVSFTVRRGEIVGLLGPNGAGKTTTIKMACGLIHPDRGRVLVGGHDSQTERLQAVRHLSAVLEGNRNFYWRFTAQENLEYFANNRGRSRASVRQEAAGLLERFGLGAKRNEEVRNLSRGMQQKLAIAVALLAGTEVVLLDEPTLGLDVEASHEVRVLLRGIAEEGRTVILSSHDMPVVEELCQRAIIINHGRVVTDDRVDELLELFRSRAFLVRLAAPMTASGLQAIEGVFATGRGVDALSFTVELGRHADLYRLVDLLRDGAAEVEAIERTTVDFEQVFRRLVNGDAVPQRPSLGSTIGDRYVVA